MKPDRRPPLVAQARADSPLGAITLAATAQGLAGLWFDGQKDAPGRLDAAPDTAQRWIAQTLRELQAYWADAATARFEVPLDLHGTEFQRKVWAALLEVRCATTCSYRAIAQRIGAAAAVRAVGAAIGRNPVSIIVPCHRVVGSDGGLTGYAGGLPRKVCLLRHEQARLAALDDASTKRR